MKVVRRSRNFPLVVSSEGRKKERNQEDFTDFVHSKMASGDLDSTTNPASAEAAVTTLASTNAPEAPISDKKVGALVLDSGGLIKNEIAVSTLISQAQELYDTPLPV